MHEQPCAKRIGSTCEQVTMSDFIDRSGVVGEMQVHRCIHCGHGVTYPPIADVSFLYEGRQSQDYQPDARNWLSHVIKDTAFGRQAAAILKDLGPVKGELLDYGCGSGQFTRVLSETAKDISVTGCDFFADPPSELDNRSYLSHAELAEQGRKFDSVLSMHVLEHDDDTRKLLQSITAPLKDGGTLVVEVPNAECFWGKVFGRFWDAWYLPYHRHHFSSSSLRLVLESQGLEVIAMRGITAPTMGRTFANVFGKKNNIFWILAGIALHPIQLAGEALSGRRTALRAVCRKSA